jgi:hypothetical protein
MARAALVLALLACACAHEARPDPAAGRLVPAQLVACAVDAPAVAGAGVPAGDVSADFQIDTRGKVRDVHLQGARGAYAKALRRHLESCEYAPATRDGRPITSRRAAVYSAYR